MTKRKVTGARHPPASKQAVVRDEGSVTAEQTRPAAAAASVAGAARQEMVAQAAYYRAEKRGFAPGCELDDWFAAEAEITGCSLEQVTPAAELH